MRDETEPRVHDQFKDQSLGEVENPTSGAETSEHTTSCARIEVLELGGKEVARVERLNTQPHVEYLAQRVTGELGIPTTDGQPLVAVSLLLNTDSGVTSISEGFLTKMQREDLARQLVVPFQ